MTTLYDDNFHYSDRAKQLDRELRQFLQPIYEEFLEEGYSPQEVTALVVHAAVAAEKKLVAKWMEAKQTSRGHA
jgi:hypothetical protein